MTDRLLQFIKAENLNQSEFADRIGVARASISHILAGRNKPGFDFIEGMARSFPALNIDWLITGKGKMYKQSGYDSYDLFSNQETLSPAQSETEQPISLQEVEIPEKTKTETEKTHSSSRVSRIIVLYDDETYQEFH